MADFKVVEIKGIDSWKGQYGEMKTYTMVVEGPDGQKEVDLNQKPETPAPEVGQTIAGELKQGKYRPKLKKDQPMGGGGGGRRGYSDEDIRRMTRSHSQEMALRREANLIADGEPGLSDEALAELIDGFDADVNQMSESVEKKTQNVANTLSSGPPRYSQEAAEAAEKMNATPNGTAPAPNADTIRQAFKEYVEREGPDSRNLVKLQLTALGIEDYESMTDEQATKLMGFLTDA